ncbi:MAG: hypothetical protein QM667_02205 [Asticcacaulis sp.]
MPFSISNVFNRAFDTLGRQFILLFGTAFVIMGLPSIISYVVVPQFHDDLGRAFAETPLLVLACGLGYILLYSLNLSVLTEIAISGIARREFRLAAALGRGLINMVPLVIIGLLSGFAIGLGLLMLIVPGIILSMALCVTSTAYVAEGGTGLFASFSRSFHLTENHRWALLGLFIILLVAQILLSLIAEAPMALVGQGMARPVIGGVTSLIGVVSDVVTIVFNTAIYAALRDAKEGRPAEATADVFN